LAQTPTEPETDKFIHFDTLMAQNPDPIPIPKIDINPKEAVAVIQYTGGTTGLPKGAELSHYNVVSNILQIKQISDYMKENYLKADAVSISVLPWYHIYGQTCEVALAPIIGSKGFILPTFDLRRIYEIMEKHKPNTMLGVPTMFLNLLNSPLAKDVDFSCLKYVNVGASAMPIEAAKEFLKSAVGKVLRRDLREKAAKKAAKK